MCNRTLHLVLLLMLAPLVAPAQSGTMVEYLHPHPKTAWQRADADGLFAARPTTQIVVPDRPDSATTRAAAYFIRHMQQLQGSALPVVSLSAYDTTQPAVIIGPRSELGDVLLKWPDVMPRGESVPDAAGGYVLDVTWQRVVVIGADADGVFNGITTLTQLTIPGDAAAFVRPCHVWDYPDFPTRWVFSQHNLRGAGAMTTLGRILDTMAAFKLNGIQQNDFKYNILDEQPAYYFDSVARFRSAAARANVSIIPGTANIGYSEGILWHDPNLAEGLPATALYVIQDDTGRIIADPRVSLPNGGFESVDGNGRFTGWSFYDEGSAAADRSTVHDGTVSARCSNFVAGNPSGNCRFNRRVDCLPYRTYVMSAWIRTQGFSADEVRLLALGVDGGGGTHALTFTAFSVPATTAGWMKVETVFNTLGHASVLLYAGVWGGRTGTIWWDDIEIRDAGMVNILRRAGTPLHVRSVTGQTEHREGTDFAPIVDSVMLGAHGTYGPYHTPPALCRIPTGAIDNGDTVAVSWFHPMTTVADAQGNGQVMVCVSENALYAILERQIDGVAALYGRDRMMLGHDEIRVMNHDSACRRRALSPAGLLADNVRRCVDLVVPDTGDPGACRPYVWSDMFDSLHNAHADYYLVNGDLAHVWDSLPRSLTIVNWNYGNRDASLAAFDRMGFRQIVSPYYDEGGTVNMRNWRSALRGRTHAEGMMYTTWSGDYMFLAPFAYYAWGDGAYIVHHPLDTSVLGGGDSAICFRATVLPDPYDRSDRVVDATVRMQYTTAQGNDTSVSITLRRDSGDSFVGCFSGMIPARGFRYSITANTTHDLPHTTPTYIIGRGGASSTPPGDPHTALRLRVAPNPAAEDVVIRFEAPRGAAWALRLYDALGRRVSTLNGIATGPFAAANAAAGGGTENAVRIPLESLPVGVYYCELITADGHTTAALHVVR